MNTLLKIADRGQLLTIDYQQALEHHAGNSIWGVAVAFRMLQLAARYFSAEKIWDRNDLYIISGHPGPGVKDTLEFVTHCISNNRFELHAACDDTCSSNMKYEWIFFNHDDVCTLKLCDDFVPDEFYTLLDRVIAKQQQANDEVRFAEFKQSLADKIWRLDLEEAFLIETGSLPASRLRQTIN